MSYSRRSKFEVWAEILEFCLKAKRTQTWLLRETRLKTNTIKEALHFLLSRNLIEQLNDDEKRTYSTSQRGEEVLKKYYALANDYFDLKRGN